MPVEEGPFLRAINSICYRDRDLVAPICLDQWTLRQSEEVDQRITSGAYLPGNWPFTNKAGLGYPSGETVLRATVKL